MDGANLNFRIAVDTAAVAPATAAVGREFEKAAAAANAALNSVSGTVKGLNAQTNQPIGATPQLETMGKAAKLTGYQTQQLSYQLNDFFVQVASGQSPMTAMIQQGSQLSGTFGGVGGALAALGSLINPVTVGLGAIAAAAGVAILAHRQGAQEAKAFNEAIVLTGNVAGVTRGQLDQMAAGVGAVVGTHGAAAQALAQLASSGLVAGNQVQQFAQHALEMERTVGRSVADTVAMFVELGKAPVQASLKLNESTHYLTAGIYEQIKALDDLGRNTEAAAVAQKAFADAENDRVKRLEANLGSLEKGWRALTNTAAKAWDAMLGIGRQASVESELSKALANAESLQKTYDARLASGKATGDIKPQLDAALALVDARKEGVKVAQKAAQLQADGVASEQARLDLSVALEGSETRREKLSKALQAANDLADRAGATPDKRAQLLAGVYDKFKDVTAKGVDAELEIVRQGEKAKEEIIKRSLIEVQAARKLGQIGEIELIERTTQLNLEQIGVKRAALVEELAWAKSKADNAKEVASLQGQIAQADAQRTTEMLKGEADKQVALHARLRAMQDIREAQIQQNQADEASESTAASKRYEQAGKQVWEYGHAIQLANEQIRFEAGLMGKSQYLRGIALDQRQVALTREKEIAAIKAAGLAADEQAVLIARARVSAETASKDVLAQAGLEQTKRLIGANGSDPFQSWGASLRDTIATANSGLARMVDGMGMLVAAGKTYSAEMAVINALRADGSESSLATAAKNEQALIARTERDQVAAYAAMANAAKGYFQQGTAGYKAIDTAEKALRIYQLSMSTKTMAQDLLGIGAKVAAWVSGDSAMVASTTTASATIVTAKAAQGQASAAAGVANQAEGDPYSAFFRMAAMAAVMAGLGYAVSASGGGGGGGIDLAARQAANGTGTVLGDDKAKSQSIADSLEMLKTVATPQLRYTSEMATSLRNIDAGINGLTAYVAKSVGLSNQDIAKAFGVKTGLLGKNTGDPIANALGLNGVAANFAIGGPLAAQLTSWFEHSAIGKALQGLWGKTTSEIQDTGLSISGSVSQLARGQGMQTYADVLTSSSSWFGLVKNSSNQRLTGTVDADAATQLGKIFDSIGATLKSAAITLGVDGKAIGSAIADFVVDIPSLSLKGLTGDALQSAISNAISAQADKLAHSVLAGFDAFTTLGEGYYETLMRVATGLDQAEYFTAKMGISTAKLSEVMNKQGDVAAELVRTSIANVERVKFSGLLGMSMATGAASGMVGKSTTGIGSLVDNFNGTAAELTDFYTQLLKTNDVLILTGAGANSLSATLLKAAGDLTTLSDNLNVYYDKFFTESEKATHLTSSTSATFAALGIKMPEVNSGLKAWFRSEIELLGAKDLSIESNAKAYTSALALAGAVDSLATSEASRQALATSWADKAAVLQGTSTSRQLQLQKDLAGTSDLAIQGLIRLVYGLEDAAAAAALTATWTDRLAMLQGSTTTRQQQLIKDLASTTDEATKDLIKSVYRMEDAKKLAETNLSWQNQLDVLTGRKTQAQVDLEIALAAATDDSTKALINAVFAQKSYAETVAATTAAFQSGLGILQSYLQAQVSAGQAVQTLLKSLQTSVNAGTSPTSRLSDARSQYLTDLAAARAGDADAYARVASSAQTYLGAGSEVYASGGMQQAIIAQVRSELSNLPGVTKLDANIVALNAIQQAILATGNTTHAALQGMASAMAFGFSQLDADNNGLLTISEFGAVMAGKATDAQIKEMFQGLDLNGDGVVSRLEALISVVSANDLNDAARIATLISTTAGGLAALDLNTNGTLTKAEFLSAMAGKASDAQLSAIWAILDTKGAGTISVLGDVKANTGATSGSTTVSANEAARQSQLQTDIWAANVNSSTYLLQIRETLTMSHQNQIGMATTLGNMSGLQGVIHSTDYATMTGYLTAINSALWQIHTHTGDTRWATVNALNLLSAVVVSGSPLTVQSAYRGGSLQTFALGGLVNTPTYFGMGAGTGLMGEAGPEFIMPAARGADGRMGVRASFPGMDLMVASMQRMEAYAARQADMLERLIVLEAEAANVSIAKQERIATAAERSARQQQLEGARA